MCMAVCVQMLSIAMQPHTCQNNPRQSGVSVLVSARTWYGSAHINWGQRKPDVRTGCRSQW